MGVESMCRALETEGKVMQDIMKGKHQTLGRQLRAISSRVRNCIEVSAVVLQFSSQQFDKGMAAKSEKSRESTRLAPIIESWFASMLA